MDTTQQQEQIKARVERLFSRQEQREQAAIRNHRERFDDAISLLDECSSRLVSRGKRAASLDMQFHTALQNLELALDNLTPEEMAELDKSTIGRGK